MEKIRVGLQMSTTWTDPPMVLIMFLPCVISCATLVTFNLGYLPGGDKAITTTADSTMTSSMSEWTTSRRGCTISGVLSSSPTPKTILPADMRRSSGGKFESTSSRVFPPCAR